LRAAQRRAYTNDVANVKGSALATRVTWVRLNHGQDGVDRLCAQVSPALAEAVKGGIAVARWYPFEQFVELVKTVDRLFGTGDGKLIHELGRFGADANLTTIYRLFFRVGTVRWVMARAARLWHLHYDAGTLELRERPDAIDLAIQDFPTPDCTHCASVRGWAERSIELSGGEDVTTEMVECRQRGGATCCMRARWT
jgi:hypothetical protein